MPLYFIAKKENIDEMNTEKNRCSKKFIWKKNQQIGREWICVELNIPKLDANECAIIQKLVEKPLTPNSFDL